jgi:hypothetical protein
MTVYRFKFLGNDNSPLIEESNEAEVKVWRRNPDYMELDVNGNKMPTHDELVAFYNKAIEKKPKKGN